MFNKLESLFDDVYNHINYLLKDEKDIHGRRYINLINTMTDLIELKDTLSSNEKIVTITNLNLLSNIIDNYFSIFNPYKGYLDRIKEDILKKILSKT